MNIVFMGTPEFACLSLDTIIRSRHNVLAVVTAPDRPRGRGQKLSFSPLKKFAMQSGLSVLQPEQLDDPGFISELEALRADIFVVVAFRILPEKVFTMPPYGSINLHASLLPAFRGAAPINRALMNGATITGVTSFMLKKRVDTGNMLLQKEVKIDGDMTAGELHDVLMQSGAETLLETLDKIESGDAKESIQDESKASPAPKIFTGDCKIDWNLAATNIHNQIRGLDPYPGAFTMWNGVKTKLYTSRLLKGVDFHGDPGKITVKRTSLIILCGQGAIEIFDIQLPGKRKMSVKDFLLGNAFDSGSKFD